MADAQELVLQLIELDSFDNFDGLQVGRDLRNNTDLWLSALYTRDDIGLILSELHDSYNADTLYVLPMPEKEDKLWELASNWGADDLIWMGGQEANQFLSESNCGPKAVLYLWWD